VFILHGDIVDINGHGPNRSAADELVDALTELGRLEDVDAADVMAARMLASSVDADPTNAALWGQYRASLDSLKRLGTGNDDELAKLLASLSAPVPDATKSEPQDVRDADRAGG
jgi:hypothetical protein